MLARLQGVAAGVAAGVATGVATVVAVATIGVPAAASAEPVPAQPGAPARPGGVALTWAPTHMADGHEYTQAEAVGIAEDHDLVAAMPIAFRDHVPVMRAANPDLTLISYLNGTLAKATKVSHLPESAFARDADGRRITSRIWGTTLMAPSSTAWRQEVDAICRDRAAEAGYDGCLVDSMGLGVFATNQGFTGLPVDPATGATYTQLDYRTALAGLAGSVRNASPDQVHTFNLVENDWRYWRDAVPSRPLALAQPSVQMEDFLRGATTGVAGFPTAEKWLRNVEVIRDLEAGNVTSLLSTKLWVTHSEAQAAQWQAYAMASFLMGADGNSYLAFTRSRDTTGATGANAPYVMPEDIGLPEGAMVRTGAGAYTRTFGSGMAIVNPTTSTVTVSLPSTMKGLDGATVTSVRLPPNSGEVLTEVLAVETVAPTGWFTSVSGDGGLAVAGKASDDVAVRRVLLAVKRISDGRWLQRDGSWGTTYQRVGARLADPGAASTRWVFRRSIAAGRYRVTLVVRDSAGKLNPAPRPYRRVTVS